MQEYTTWEFVCSALLLLTFASFTVSTYYSTVLQYSTVLYSTVPEVGKTAQHISTGNV